MPDFLLRYLDIDQLGCKSCPQYIPSGLKDEGLFYKGNCEGPHDSCKEHFRKMLLETEIYVDKLNDQLREISYSIQISKPTIIRYKHLLYPD